MAARRDFLAGKDKICAAVLDVFLLLKLVQEALL